MRSQRFLFKKWIKKLEEPHLISCPMPTLMRCAEFGVSMQFGCVVKQIINMNFVNETTALMGTDIEFNREQTDEYVQSIKGLV